MTIKNVLFYTINQNTSFETWAGFICKMGGGDLYSCFIETGVYDAKF